MRLGCPQHKHLQGVGGVKYLGAERRRQGWRHPDHLMKGRCPWCKGSGTSWLFSQCLACRGTGRTSRIQYP